MKRDSVVFIFRMLQLAMLAVFAATLFLIESASQMEVFKMDKNTMEHCFLHYQICCLMGFLNKL